MIAIPLLPRLSAPWLFALLLALPIGVVHADPQPRNDTGQATCFNPEGEPIDCSDQEFPGQDAAIGRDRAASTGSLVKVGAGAGGFDFTKIANDGGELPATATPGDAPGQWACTRDNLTGFLWEVKTDAEGPRYRRWAYGWYDPQPGNGGDPGEPFDPQPMCGFTMPCNTQAFIDYVNSIALCGRTDWRLPSLDELTTVVHYGASGDYAIDEDYFVAPPVVWTRDSALEPPDGFAQSVVLLDGHVEPAPKNSGHATPMLVSGAPFISAGEPPLCGDRENPEIFPSTAGAFELLAEGLVRDNRTDLVWDRCSIGQDMDGEGEKITCNGEAQPMGWNEALQRVRELNEQNYRGHDDWRMPNIKELLSIMERRCGMPVLDVRVFPNQNPEPIWSSTSYQWDGRTDHAWTLQMEMGQMLNWSKNDPARMRVVRGGRDFDDYQGPTAFSIGGTLAGMVGSGLTLNLQAGGSDTLVLNTNGDFQFALGVPDGTPYEVTLGGGPVPAQSCSVANGSGTVVGAHVANVEVTCAPPAPAGIEVTPAAFDFHLAPGAAGSDMLSIGNVGGGILHWSINTAYAARGAALMGVPVVDCADPTGLIVHDDGSAESAIGGASNWQNGLILVERFVPSTYPASIATICLPLVVQGASTANFEIVVFRDNGPGGAPGAEIASLPASASGIPTYPVAEPQWFQFDLGAIYTTIDSGGLYLGLRGLPTTPNLFLLTDESEGHPPGYGEGYWKRNGIWQALVDVQGLENYRSTLMRTAPAAAQPLPVGCDDPHTVPWLSLDRYSGQTNAGAVSDVQVQVDATGLAPGAYHALLCVESDGGSRVEIPVDLAVELSHVVTPSAGPHGSITPAAAQTVPHGATVEFQLTAESGWRIAAVGGTCGGSLAGNVYTTLPVTADCTVEASFEATTWVVTPSAGPNGSIDPAIPQTVAAGTAVSFTLTPADGYRVAAVDGSCGGFFNDNVFTTFGVVRNCTVEASFEPAPVLSYTVTPGADAHAWVDPATPQVVPAGAQAAFQVGAEAGWVVSGVTGTCGGALAGDIYTTQPVQADCTVQVQASRDAEVIFVDGFDS